MKLQGFQTSCATATAILTLAACSEGPQEATQAPAAQTAAAPPAQYDAKACFTTTSYSLPAGYAWSNDDQQLLVSSDETGIYNAYALPAAGAAKQPLTTSTVDSTFAVSWFPSDGRVLFTADKG